MNADRVSRLRKIIEGIFATCCRWGSVVVCKYVPIWAFSHGLELTGAFRHVAGGGVSPSAVSEQGIGPHTRYPLEVKPAPTWGARPRGGHGAVTQKEIV